MESQPAGGSGRFAVYVDVMFRKIKLAIEIDGRLYHTGAEVFERDRWRQNLLILNGWCVLRFTWTMIEEQPEKVVAMVREAIRMLSNLKGSKVDQNGLGPRAGPAPTGAAGRISSNSSLPAANCEL